ncbi:TAP-like protein-domain-containing protein [Mycena capillaripes]|nr:TAP-like protein-domain-containing protein [Mycena capillaripes]
MLRITEAFGCDKLQYWGISYGSVLGSTFASMFPDKVGRIVIDGVLDMEAWYSSNITSEQVDTDKALQIFIDACFAAGPDDCAYYAPSTAEISANLNKLLDSVKTQPVPVMTPISYTVFGYTLLKNSIFDALYSPSQSFATLAQGLTDLVAGNASTIYSAFVEIPPFECGSESNSSLPLHENAYEASSTISCGDGPPVNDSISQLQGFYSAQQEVSRFSDIWFNLRVICSCVPYYTYISISIDSLWKRLEATSRGPLRPFGAPNTSFPLLIIGNTIDPVAPISGAKSTMGLFPGSVLLTLDTVAHTSVNAPSTCVYGHLGQYFRNGTLPAQGTVCSPDDPLFPSNNADVLGRDVNRPSELLRAGRAIGEAYRRVTSRKAPLTLLAETRLVPILEEMELLRSVTSVLAHHLSALPQSHTATVHDDHAKFMHPGSTQLETWRIAASGTS